MMELNTDDGIKNEYNHRFTVLGLLLKLCVALMVVD